MHHTPSATTTSPVWTDHAIFKEEHEQRLLETDHGRVALMSDGELIGLFDDTSSATNAGYKQFGIGGFSTHPIGHAPVRIGSILGRSLTEA